MKIIYLVGQISSDERTYKWRKNIEEYVSERPTNIVRDIIIINPCMNQINQLSIKQAANNENEYNKLMFSHESLSILPALDAGYVRDSTMAIANLNHYTPERPIVGTYFELAWYSMMYPDKPIIGIFDGDPSQDYQCKHPFVQNAIHAWVKNEYDAIKLILNQC